MTISQALKLAPRTEIDLFLSHILKKPKEFLFLHPKLALTRTQQRGLHTLRQRRRQGEPIAYILGYKYFYGLKFAVNNDVLIPRPETEWLIDRALLTLRYKLRENKAAQPLRVLDLGTGSGCIAISLAKKIRNQRVKIFASDVSAKALAVAKKNARFHKTSIKLVRSNLFNKLPGQFDLIIANLPYVPNKDYGKLFNNLRYEPKLALTDETDKWQIYKMFLEQLPKHISGSATILLEVDPQSQSLLRQYLKKYLPQAEYSFWPDLHKHIRYLEIHPL